MRTALAYREQLQALLPAGPAWPRDEDAVLTKLLHGLAEGLARVDGRGLALLEEADPLTTLEMLPDWERALGLPDPCTGIAAGTTERQLAVARKLAGIGGQSRAFFIELALRLGLDVEIVEYRPFTAGSRAGTRCYDGSWRFAWKVRLLPASEASAGAFDVHYVYFTAGHSRAGDRLRTFGVASLECVIKRARPAHTYVLFSYPIDPEPMLWFDFLTV